MKKRFHLLLALSLAASVQAQNASVAAPATQPASAEAPVAAPASQPAPVAEPAAESAQPVETVSAADAASADSAANAVAEPAPVTDSTIVDTAASEQVSTSNPEPSASPVAAVEAVPADSVVVDSAVAAPEQVAVADSAASAESATAAATDSLANDTSKVAKAPVNKLGDILHSNAYNTVGNEAAAATIGGNIGVPHYMHGSRLVYFDPMAQQGALAFGDSWTYFLYFDNNKKVPNAETELGFLTAGIAFSKFGASIDYSFAKNWRYTDHADGSEETEKNTTQGSIVGANLSANFGSFDVLVKGHYLYPNGQSILTLSDSENELDAWSAWGYVGVSYSGDVYYWTLGVDGTRNEYKNKTKNTEIKVMDGKNYMVTTKTSMSDTTAGIVIAPAFTIGAAVLSSENANVYLGLNTFVPMERYDEIDSVSDKHDEARLEFVPNILAEVQLSKYLMAFGGASYKWVAASYTNRKLDKEKEKTIATNMEETTVELGARFNYGPVAVEAAFTRQFLKNPFSGYGDKAAIVTSLGAFIFF